MLVLLILGDLLFVILATLDLVVLVRVDFQLVLIDGLPRFAAETLRLVLLVLGKFSASGNLPLVDPVVLELRDLHLGVLLVLHGLGRRREGRERLERPRSSFTPHLLS